MEKKQIAVQTVGGESKFIDVYDSGVKVSALQERAGLSGNYTATVDDQGKVGLYRLEVYTEYILL